MRLPVLIGASLCFVAVAAFAMSSRLGYPPSTPQGPPARRDDDPYAQPSDVFLQEIKAIEQFTPEFRKFNWSKHGPLEAARWGVGAPIRVMAVGQLHARELFSAELLRLWMVSMITAKRPDSGMVDWLFVPVANPCGRDRVVSGYVSLRDRHKENATIEWQVCQRTNCAGVDLNRNWDTERGMLAGPENGALHWDRSPETNPGNEAFSEPETRELRLLLHEFNPHILLNVHTGANTIKSSPEDGAKIFPRNMAFVKKIYAWIVLKTGCCPPRDRLGPVSQGTMTDYASRKLSTPIPLTLEVYRGVNAEENFTASSPEYPGRERYGQDARNCLRRFNPPKEGILEAAAPWLRLWRALFYLKDQELAFIKDNIESF